MSRWRKELEGRLRAARPAADAAPLTPRERDTLARILADDSPPAGEIAVLPLPRPRTRLPIAAAAVVALVALVTAAVVFGRPQPAYAATPPPLVATPIAQTASEVLNEAAAAVSPGRAGTSTIVSHTWALNSEPDEHGDLTSVVEPFVVTLSYYPDGEVRRAWRTGEPWPENAPGAVPAGQFVSEEVFAPGEFEAVFAEPPTGPGQYRPFFAATGYLADSPVAGDYLELAAMLMNERSLSSDQEVALLRFLAELPDLNVDGQVTDRLGRAGVKLSATTPMPGDFIPSLIVSVTGQGMLSYESTYVGGGRSDIASPSVVYYNAWER